MSFPYTGIWRKLSCFLSSEEIESTTYLTETFLFSEEKPVPDSDRLNGNGEWAGQSDHAPNTSMGITRGTVMDKVKDIVQYSTVGAVDFYISRFAR